MIKNFEELLERVKQTDRKTIGIAGAADKDILELVQKCEAFSDFILIGDKDEIHHHSKQLGFRFKGEIIHETDDQQSAIKAVQLVKDHRVQTLMKGLIHSSTFLKAMFNKEKGLNEGKLISQISVFEKNNGDGFQMITDCAIAVKPTLKEKIQIIENAVDLANRLGCSQAKVAVLSALEVVNLNMPETTDAAILSKMSQRGQIKNAIVDGPLSFDVAVDPESAKHKGVVSAVAGMADILVVPDLQVGNMVSKALNILGKKRSAAATMGLSVPVVFTSRVESIENKMFTIALSSYVSRHTVEPMQSIEKSA